TRSGMLDVLSQDFIRTARAKGVGDPPVVWKHALKNAAIPIVTIVGIELGTLLGGSVITETIFAWPGVGRLSVQAIYNRDSTVVPESDSGAARVALPMAHLAAQGRREWLAFSRRLVRRRTALFGAVVVAVVLAVALAAPLVSPFDPLGQDLENRLRPPGWQDGAGYIHPLGTDHLGRDILARVIFGARPALLVGVAAV